MRWWERWTRGTVETDPVVEARKATIAVRLHEMRLKESWLQATDDEARERIDRELLDIPRQLDEIERRFFPCGT